MKIFHLGLCVAPQPFNELQLSFIRNSTEYRELNCGVVGMNEKAIEIAREFKPDLIFIQIQAPDIIHYETVEFFRRNGAFVVNWTGDVRNSVPKWMYNINPNITLFSNMRDVHEMNNTQKAGYLEIGYNEHIYKPEGGFHLKMPPIVFFGNNYGAKHFPMSAFRIQMVESLRKKFGDKFGVFGTGWKTANGNFNHSQEEEASAYRGAAIAINCSHYEIEKYSSDRLLRILGTGVPVCLCKKYPGMQQDYTLGKHLVGWDTVQELIEHIEYFLIAKNHAAQTAKHGMELAQQKFTFDHMVKNLIQIYHDNK